MSNDLTRQIHHFVTTPLALVTAVAFASACFAASDPAKSESLATRRAAAVTLEDHRNVFFLFNDTSYAKTLQEPNQLKQALEEVLDARTVVSGEVVLTNMTQTERNYAALNAERAQLVANLAIIEKRAQALAAADPKALDARAREIYLTTDASALKREYAADFQHILFDLRVRDFSETAKRIAAAQAELAAGKSFDEVVAAYSDEPKAKETNGKFTNVLAKNMEGIVARTMFEELKPGEVSKPLPSRLGIHIFKLLTIQKPEKRPYEEVKEALYARLIDEAGKSAKAVYQAELRKPPTVFNEPLIKSFVLTPDPLAIQKARETSLEASKKSQEEQLKATPK